MCWRLLVAIYSKQKDSAIDWLSSDQFRQKNVSCRSSASIPLTIWRPSYFETVPCIPQLFANDTREPGRSVGVAIETYANELNRRHELEVQLEISPELPRLSEDAEVALFRIVQTSLTNVHLHSGTSGAKIKVDHNAETLTLRVSDHGRGIPAGVLDHFLKGEATGIGIAGMRERAVSLGGSLDFETSESGPEHGTAVVVTIP